MKIGLFSDSLGEMSFETMLDWLVSEGIEAVEIGTGNFSPSPHCDLDKLVDDEDYRTTFIRSIKNRGLELSALNCNGNLLDPHPDRRALAQSVFHKTIVAASKLRVDTVVTMSGCPGDLDGGTYPNWITCTWQSEYIELLERQWDEVVEPFWREAGQFAAERGVRIAIEIHPGQVVYNTYTFLRLREIVGHHLGVNLDPSQLFFQGMDPLVVVRSLGKNLVFHVHAKDTRVDPLEMALNGGFDTRTMEIPGSRSWDYRTVGYGHDARWWRDYVSVLQIIGYNGVLSIEHEDRLMGAHEGIRKSVDFLKPIILRTPPE
jgi:sugar phosphate isomerase/epimerase